MADRLKPFAHPPESVTPAIGIRFLCWLGIYFAAQLPLVFDAPFFFLFPQGLISPYLALIWPIRPTDNYFPADLQNYPANLISYLFYGIHFCLTFLLPSRRAFRILMIVLIIAVVLNLGGCEIAKYAN